MARCFSHVSPVLCTAALAGCLPVDTRPEPGRVVVVAELAPELGETRPDEDHVAFTTDDGWAVTLDRLLLGIGSLEFSGESCNDYSEAHYGRVLDMRRRDRQKIGQIWGLNSCQLDYRVRIPNEVAVLGAGVTAADREFMMNAVVPMSSPTGLTNSRGMALHVRGFAEKDGVRVSFDWGFEGVPFTQCRRLLDGKLEEYLPLTGGQTIEVSVGVDPRRLFSLPQLVGGSSAGTTPEDAGAETTPGSSSPHPLMQHIADADRVTGNANGLVGVDELLLAVLPAEESPTGTSLSVAEAMRQQSYPSMFLFDQGGQCIIGSKDRGGPGGM